MPRDNDPGNGGGGNNGGGGGGGGGNGGGGGGGRDDRRPGRNRPPRYRQRATRDIAAAFQPQYDLLTRQEESAEADADQYLAQIQQLYASLGESLGALGPQYQAQIAPIQQQLLSSLQGLAGSLPNVGQMPGSELAAGQGVYGGVGEAGLATLASQAARGAGYNTSALRQGQIDATNYQANVLQELQQFRESLSSQREDLASQQAPLILSRIDEMRQQAEQMALANREFRLRQSQVEAQIGQDQSILDFTQQQAEDALGGGGGGGGSGGGNGGNGGGGNANMSDLAQRFLAGEAVWSELGPGKRERLRNQLPRRRIRRTRRRYGAPAVGGGGPEV